MVPEHFYDVTNDKSRSGNSIWCRSQTRNTRAIRNDEDHYKQYQAKHECETSITREQRA